MSKNLIALLMILAALLGALGEWNGWLLPTLSWPFTVRRARTASFRHFLR